MAYCGWYSVYRSQLCITFFLYALTQIHSRTSGSVDDALKLSLALNFIASKDLTPPRIRRRLLSPTTIMSALSLPTRTPLILLRAQTQTRKMPKPFDELDNGTEHGSTEGTEHNPENNHLFIQPIWPRLFKPTMRRFETYSIATPGHPEPLPLENYICIIALTHDLQSLSSYRAGTLFALAAAVTRIFMQGCQSDQ